MAPFLSAPCSPEHGRRRERESQRSTRRARSRSTPVGRPAGARSRIWRSLLAGNAHTEPSVPGLYASGEVVVAAVESSAAIDTRNKAGFTYDGDFLGSVRVL